MAQNFFCDKSNKTDPPIISSTSNQDAESSDANVDVALALDLVEYLDLFKLISLADVENVDPKDFKDLLHLEELLGSEDVEDLHDLSRAFAPSHPRTSENARNNVPFFFNPGNDKNSTQLTIKKCKNKKNKKLKKCKNKNSKDSKGQQFFLRWDFLDEEQGWQ